MVKQDAAGLANYLTVSEAAEFLGVSPWTLRNWDKAGKLKPARHPKNGYRIYRHEDLQAVLDPIAQQTLRGDWNDMADSDHFVQFYETDEFLVESVSGYVGAALAAEDAAIIIATPDHRAAIQRELLSRGLDVSSAIERGQFLLLDAQETLAKIVVDDAIDPARFADVVGAAIVSVKQDRRRVRAFGEMVAVLWAEGNPDAAVQLEEQWNELTKLYTFSLFCAYPMSGFGGKAGAGFDAVCKCHTRVLPAESFASLLSADDRARAISRLQQQAAALEAEIEHREHVEAVLREREEQYRKLMEQAEHASNVKDQFLAVLSHELRTPLSPVTMMLDAMHADPSLPENLRGDIAMIRRNIALETRLIDDLLDLTRVTNGKLSLRKENIRLHPLIQEIAKMIAGEAAEKNLSIDRDLNAGCDGVYGDPARLQQIIWNLLRNAVKFTPENGRISVTTRSEGTLLIITVADTGIGIDPAVLPTIFNAFDQGQRGTNRIFGGLGLGLAISRALVNLHGGKISAQSDGAGQGARFTVELPCVELPDKPPTAEPAPSVAKTQALRILLVDDHVDTLRVLRRLLEISGFHVRSAENVAQASREIDGDGIDLLISDIGLPDGTGLDIVKKLRERHPLARAIALTGFGMEHDVRSSEDAGFDAHLIKPVSIDQLKTTIVKLTASAREN
jgi:signal transduction histidine kinase/ActR/RegA family two-component response regulator